jgi:hypothetical protein
VDEHEPNEAPAFDIEELRAILAGVRDMDTRRRLASMYAHTHTWPAAHE